MTSIICTRYFDRDRILLVFASVQPLTDFSVNTLINPSEIIFVIILQASFLRPHLAQNWIARYTPLLLLHVRVKGAREDANALSYKSAARSRAQRRRKIKLFLKSEDICIICICVYMYMRCVCVCVCVGRRL